METITAKLIIQKKPGKVLIKEMSIPYSFRIDEDGEYIITCPVFPVMTNCIEKEEIEASFRFALQGFLESFFLLNDWEEQLLGFGWNNDFLTEQKDTTTINSFGSFNLKSIESKMIQEISENGTFLTV